MVAGVVGMARRLEGGWGWRPWWVDGEVAVADVTIDICVARNSIEVTELVPDMQSLCGFCSSVGALVGFSTSGFFVHHLGPQVCSLSLSLPSNVLTTASGSVWDLILLLS